MFGLPDCAAEVINAFPNHVAAFVEPAAALDALVRGVEASGRTYAASRARFEADPTAFYPADHHHQEAPPATDGVRTALSARLKELENALREARRDVVRLTREHERSEACAAE